MRVALTHAQYDFVHVDLVQATKRGPCCCEVGVMAQQLYEAEAPEAAVHPAHHPGDVVACRKMHRACQSLQPPWDYL